MLNFKDNFSVQSDIYVKYRPHYPAELFLWLSSLTPKHNLVWDCGTGNGQAAIYLAEYYDKVIATDPSEKQISNAIPHAKVTYKVEKAENNSLGTHAADLITVANALHWFDFDNFYHEVKRVLIPGGIFAAWAYGLPVITPEIDAVVRKLHDETLGPFWLAENRLVEKEYTTVPFPFELLDAPEFFYEKKFTLKDYIGALNTWSATQRFIQQKGYNPVDEVYDTLKNIWADEQLVRWKLILKVGKV